MLFQDAEAEVIASTDDLSLGETAASATSEAGEVSCRNSVIGGSQKIAFC